MGEKKSIDIRTFWYTDVLVIPKFVTIVTTLDRSGRLNAAPYSLGTPYNVGNKNPRILLGIRHNTHSFKNIMDTLEFVINFPSWDFLDDMMETARFWPMGESEINHTSFSLCDSHTVKPPSIRECRQHIECRLHDVFHIDMGQSFVVADIIDIVVDEELLAMDRAGRIASLDLPVYLGDERRRFYFFGRAGSGEVRRIELKRPDSTEKIQHEVTTMPWEDKARQRLERVPSFMLETAVEMIEAAARKQGLTVVSYEFYRDIEEQYMPNEVQERFD